MEVPPSASIALVEEPRQVWRVFLIWGFGLGFVASHMMGLKAPEISRIAGTKKFHGNETHQLWLAAMKDVKEQSSKSLGEEFCL